VSIALTVLVARLQNAVPQRNGAPADYSRLVQDAVQQLGQDVPIITTATLAVVAGTATYTLPDDFLFEIELSGPAAVGDVIVGSGKLIPMPGQWSEAHYIEGGSIRFDPVPGYTLDRTLRYAAGYVLVNDRYPRLSENGARIALLYAQHLALVEQANAVAGDGWSYKIGDESVDKRGQGAAIQTQAAVALANYQNAVKPLKGYGSQYRANPYIVGDV
jgi:hypothetical protein